MRWGSVAARRRSCTRRSRRPRVPALAEQALGRAKPSTSRGKIVKTSMRTVASGRSRPVGRVDDRRRHRRTVDDETQRHERTAVEHEQVAGRVRDRRRRPRPSGCPARSTTAAPISSCTHSASGSSIGSARRRRRRSALGARRGRRRPRSARSSRPGAGRDDATASGRRDRSASTAPGATRSAGSVTRSTTTSPRSPCGLSDRSDLEQGSGHAQSASQTVSRRSRRRPRRRRVTAAARSTVRIGCAMRPRLPITRPMSPGATLTSRLTPRRPSTASTSTASGSSTSARTRYSSTARAVAAGMRLAPSSSSASSSSSSRRSRNRRRTRRRVVDLVVVEDVVGFAHA